MSRITSKYQVTVPKAIAEQYGIGPGDEIHWLPAGDSIRVTLADRPAVQEDVAARLRLFDQATERERLRKASPRRSGPPQSRGWSREDLYTRGRAR